MSGSRPSGWTSNASWSNWAGNQEAAGIVRVHPTGADQIAATLVAAAGQGRRVRPVGSGHSFTAIARPDPAVDPGRPGGVQICLDRHADAISVDVGAGLVTVQAGMPLHRLNVLLQAAGLALTNLGDIDRQTISGAVSTGTHGTGLTFGGLATQLRGLQLVLADGTVLDCSPRCNPEVFAAARVGLGALGVLSSLTLAVEPLFALRATERPFRLEETLEGFAQWCQDDDHVEFYWFPHTRMTSVKRNNRVPAEAASLRPLPGWRAWLDDEFLANTAFSGVVGLGRRVPATVRPMAQLAARALTARTYTDVSHRVFTSPRRVRFQEMEYAVPLENLLPAVRALVAAVEASDLLVPFPVEVRVAAADDIALSTASGRVSGYVAAHVPAGTDPAGYFPLVESIMVAAGGRPHWGKLHGLDAAALRERYPRFEEFVALRDRLDPTGLFANDHLDRVLGPAPGSPA